MDAERKRLDEARTAGVPWKRWGPYLAERAWGTVREDYSDSGNAWEYFPHDHARSRAYRWNEDGMGGICDDRQILCLAFAFWNGRDPILKERHFGLTGSEGNHGEDVKEYWWYQDSTSTHSWMRWRYVYPHAAFPYVQLLEENRRRGRADPEYELLDTGIFKDNRYWDITADYAKASTDDILIRLTVRNAGPEAATLEVLPTIWFRNTWSWGYDDRRPRLMAGDRLITTQHRVLAPMVLAGDGDFDMLFCENESNAARLWGVAGGKPYPKDGINDYVIAGLPTVNPEQIGTKAALRYRLVVEAGRSATIRLRLTDGQPVFGPTFDQALAQRQQEADAFYAALTPADASADEALVMRQAFAGMLWSKQYYHLEVEKWLRGDPAGPVPPPGHQHGRNAGWTHLDNRDVVSMPDKWEYPWYAAWDLAFHCVALAHVDPDFAREQLILLLREWYMHPNGQLPAYEWAFGDVNPPVHAWAAWRVYKIEQKRRGKGDRKFLERVFHKLMLNFTWWVNRKDAAGRNVFQGGFLGLDNIGVFDRSAPLPTGGHIEQSDGTSWMGMYCLNLLAIALELAREDPAYEDVASKFWEHFVYIAYAMNNLGDDGIELWDEADGFYYDVLHLPDGNHFPLKVRSMVGLIPLFAVETLEPEQLVRLPGFKRRLEWFIDHRPDLTRNLACMRTPGRGERRLLSIVDRDRLRRVLGYMLDENEFLSPYGIRALSRFHHDHPYTLSVNGMEHRVDYEPAESSTGLFGGNSNWRGPIWFPVNYLLIESLQKFHHYLGDSYKVECPTGSGQQMTLWEVAAELSRRLTRIFLHGPDGRRAVYGGTEKFQRDPHWQDLIFFYEYFHGDNGAGIGASHQTGWTGLVAKLLQQSGE